MKLVVLFLLATAPAVSKQQRQNGRIIGGNHAFIGQFPFAAALYVTTTDNRFFCSGSIIDAEWVLTAAQCVNQAKSVNVLLGSNLLEGEDKNRVNLISTEFVVHPDFNSTTLENDIGLVKIPVVNFTEYIHKVDIGNSDLNDSASVVAIGWGQISDNNADLSNDLQFVELVVVPNDQCKVVYGNQISDHMVCVNGKNNEGTCAGDSGGALLQYNSDNQSVRNVGISSFLSGNGCESLDPSGYTKTYSFNEWITNVTGIAS